MSTSITTNVAPKAKKAELSPAQKLGNAIAASAASDVIVKFARPELARMALEYFNGRSLSVAEAAVELELDISAKGMDKGSKEAAFVQRTRVNLQRALCDAGVLKLNPNLGRKAGDKADKTTPKGRGSESAIDAILRMLPTLSNDELDRVTDAMLVLTTR